MAGNLLIRLAGDFNPPYQDGIEGCVDNLIHKHTPAPLDRGKKEMMKDFFPTKL